MSSLDDAGSTIARFAEMCNYSEIFFQISYYSILAQYIRRLGFPLASMNRILEKSSSPG
jgi:hypothetical protein